MQPDEIREILEYIGQQSVSNAPFDVVVAEYVGNKTPDNAAALLRSYAEAGVTWWQEGFLPNDTLDDVRHRIHQGATVAVEHDPITSTSRSTSTSHIAAPLMVR